MFVPTPHPSSPRSTPLRAWLAVLLSSGLGVVAALSSRNPDPSEASGLAMNAAGVPTTLEQTLDAVSALAEVRPLVVKFRSLSKDNPPAAGVNALLRLGQAVGQWQRQTDDAQSFDWAESLYSEALSRDARSLEALLGLAWATGGRHEFSQSQAWAQRALALDPQCAGAYGFLGDASLERGQMEDALEYYQKMIDSKPDLSSWSRGAHALWMMGDSAKAQWLMRKAIAAGSPHVEDVSWCQVQLAEMLWHEGAYLAARHAVAPALATERPLPAALLTGAKISLSEGKLDEAEKHFRQAIASRQEIKGLAGLLEVLLARGKSSEAADIQRQLDQLLTQESVGHGHDHTFQAKVWSDHGRELTAALRLVERQKLTQNPLEADTLAWVYYHNGNMPGAIDAIKRALKHRTPIAEIHYHAGLIAEQFGDLAAARRHLQQALQMNPKFHPRHAPRALERLQALDNKPSLTSADAMHPTATSPATPAHR